MLVAASLTPSLAEAACPGIYSTATCNGGTGGDVCWKVNATTVVCDLGIEDDTYGSNIKAVSPSNTTFRAFGEEGDGESFCCEFTNLTDGCSANPISITITGTEEQDTVDLNDTAAGLSLDCSVTVVDTEDEVDTITGSNSTTNYDYLYGGSYGDTIHGANGDDHIYGESGDDTLYGDDDDDYIYGDLGNDNITDLFKQRDLKHLQVFASQASLLVHTALMLNELKTSNRNLRNQLRKSSQGEMIGSCDNMQQDFRIIRRSARRRDLWSASGATPTSGSSR